MNFQIHNFGVKVEKSKFRGKKIYLPEYIPMIMGVENSENDDIRYVRYILFVGVANIIPIVRLDMTYVNIQLP